MFLDPEQNWDGEALAADHSVPRALGGTRADRLLHGICNKRRGTGQRDDQRPAVTGEPVAQRLSEREADADLLGHRAMPWPI